MDNTLLNLLNSSCPTQPHSLIIIANWSDFYRFPINMAVSAYLLENAILGFLYELPGPTVGQLQLSPPKKNMTIARQMPGGMRTLGIDRATINIIFIMRDQIKAWLHRFVAISSGDRCLSLKILLPLLLPLAAVRCLKLSVWTCGGKQDSACLL